MIKRLLKDSMIYGVSGVVARFIGVFLMPFYTRVFTPADYGIMDVILISTVAVNFLVSLQMDQAVARLYPDRADDADGIKTASTGLLFYLVAYAAFTLLALPASGFIARTLLEDEALTSIVVVAILLVGMKSMFQYGLNMLRWRLEPVKYSISSLVVTIGSIVLSILFVLVMRWGLWGAILAQLIGITLGAGTTLWFGRSSYRLMFDGRRFIEMARFSVPLIPAAIAGYALTYTGRWAIKETLTLHELGLYSVGNRFASLFSMPVNALYLAWLPLIYASYRRPETPAAVARVFRYFVFGALLGFAVLSLFSREAILILATEDYVQASTIVPLLVAGTIVSFVSMFAIGISIAKKNEWAALWNTAGAVTNIVLNVVLTPRFGMYGAATAALVSYAVILVSTLTVSQRFYPVPHNWGACVVAAGAAVCAVVLGLNAGINSWGDSIALKMSLLVALVLVMIAVRLVRLDDVVPILDKVKLIGVMVSRRRV